MKPSISLVIPARNEERTLSAVVGGALDALPRWSDDYEVVILDDGSTDRTRAIAEELAAACPQRVRVLAHDAPRGIAATFEELYAAAAKEIVTLLPADNEYPLEALGRSLPLLDQYDVVIWRRSAKPYSAWRRVVSAGFRLLPRLLFGVELFDAGSVKVMRRTVLAIPVRSKSVFNEAERLIRAARRGYRIGAIDICQSARVGGKARGARLGVVLAACRDMLRLWFELVLLRSAP